MRSYMPRHVGESEEKKLHLERLATLFFTQFGNTGVVASAGPTIVGNPTTVRKENWAFGVTVDTKIQDSETKFNPADYGLPVEFCGETIVYAKALHQRINNDMP